MSDTQTPREIRDVVLARDDEGNPTWTIGMRTPSADLVALATSRFEDIDEASVGEAITIVQDLLTKFVRPLIIDPDDARDLDKELYRMAHCDEDWISWLLKGAIFGDCGIDLGNREQRRSSARGRRRGGNRGRRRH